MPDFDSQRFIKTLTTHPGIYQMLGAKGEVLYVGKARNLKKRVSSYFQRQTTNSKTAALVKNIVDINVIVTASENEALLLENTLIKQLKPKYNILFRDDKSYPYIFLSAHVDYPRLDLYRGSKSQSGRYFGPYPSTLAVREAIHFIQKLFKIRQCQDSFFRHRSRPCLQYYIQRCSGPCVGLIDPESYQRDVKNVVLFLEGKNQDVMEEWAKRMEAASEALDFEKAAEYRDQIAKLRQIQERQYVMGSSGDVDVIAVVKTSAHACLQVLFIRAGRLLGNKVFFPNLNAEMTESELLASFLPQYYLNSALTKTLPKEILVNVEPTDRTWLEKALTEQCGHAVKITMHVRGERARWLHTAMNNAKQALTAHVAHKIDQSQRMEALQEALGLDVIPQRLECFDISHTMGEATVASCVVFDAEGAFKADYRRFNIKDITPGDDYAAMRQALTRHYMRIKKEEEFGAPHPYPDILFIDGGKGQLSQAEAVLEELQITGILLVAIAKGPERKPGLETLFVSGGNNGYKQRPYHLQPDSLALHLIQQIRDEAHRFAITGHRKQRAAKRNTSTLESIPGVGAKRRRELLRQFGGLSEVKRASIEELAKVPGISRALAERLYEALH